MLVNDSGRVCARNHVSDEERPGLRILNTPQGSKTLCPWSKLGKRVTRLCAPGSEPWRCSCCHGVASGRFRVGSGGRKSKIAELCASKKTSLSGSRPSPGLAHPVQSNDSSDLSLCFVLPPSSPSTAAGLVILTASRETENGVCCLLN